MAVVAPVARHVSLKRAIVGALAVSALDATLIALALGGLAALLAHQRALALLAVWLVGGVFLSLRRPVRFHDPIGSASEPPWTLTVLFFLPLFVPPLSAYGERIGLWLLPGGEPLRWSGVAISGLGLAIRVAAMSRLGSRFSPFILAQRGHVLETAGLYAIIRHPGYLGSFLAAFGTVIAFGSAVGFALVVPLYLVLDQRMRREDAFLESQFGEAFRVWKAGTGKFVPRLGGH